MAHKSWRDYGEMLLLIFLLSFTALTAGGGAAIQDQDIKGATATENSKKEQQDSAKEDKKKNASDEHSANAAKSKPSETSRQSGGKISNRRMAVTTDRYLISRETVGTDERSEGLSEFLMADDKPSTMVPADRALRALSIGQRTEQGLALVQRGGTPYRILHVEFKSEILRKSFHLVGTAVFASFGEFADMFVSSDKVADAIAQRPDVLAVELGKTIKAPPPTQLANGVPTRARPEPILHDGIGRLTGKGVIVAVIDTGIDFRNPAFITYENGRPTSRLLYLWDTMGSYASGVGSPFPRLSFPDGTPVGTLYTRAQLTADLRAPVFARKVPTPDENGHGTAAASIALGNGNGANGNPMYVGVAPNADIIGVRIGDTNGLMSNAYLLNAIVQWLDEVARQAAEPVVISCSFGGHYGGHNGNRIFERHLSARFQANTSGRAIAIAAGNERLQRVHAKVTIGGPAKPGYLGWTSHVDGAVLEIHTSAASQDRSYVLDVSYNLRSGSCADPTDLQKTADFHTQFKSKPETYFDGISKEWVTAVPVGIGCGAVKLNTDSGTSLIADAYFVNAPDSAEFFGTYNVGGEVVKIAYQGEQVETPGSTINAVTVGSYDWNDSFDGEPKNCSRRPSIPVSVGELSCYSNLGYDRGGVVKPDIVAPGEVYYGSYARLANGSGLNSVLKTSDGSPYWELDRSGRFVLFTGTSAATPYVAGVIALMMEKKPTITAGEIKRLLQRNASQDPFYTGQVPNPRWGYGKLDLDAVQAILSGIQ